MLVFKVKVSFEILPVPPIPERNLYVLHLGTAADSHISASWTTFPTHHVLVIPPENGVGLVDRGALRLMHGDAERWTPKPVKVAGLHFN